MRLLNRPFLHLVSVDGDLDLKVAMGDGPATPTAGIAGYETVARRRRKAMTAFAGLEPFQQDVPVLLDGYADNESVERQLERLEEFGGATRFKAEGPIHRSGEVYVMGDEPDFGEAIRNPRGVLVRQRLTLKLMEYVPATYAGKKRDTRRAGRVSQQAIPLTYDTMDGDTLWMIAAKFYGPFGAAANWKRIGKLNGISDPWRKLPGGRRIILPTEREED